MVVSGQPSGKRCEFNSDTDSCLGHSIPFCSPQAAQPSEQLVQIFHTYQQTVWKVCNGRRRWGLPSTLGTFLKIYDAAYAYRS